MGFPKYSECRVYPKKGIGLQLAIVGTLALIWSWIGDYRQQLQWLEEGRSTVISYSFIYVGLITMSIIMTIIYLITISRKKFLYDLEDAYVSRDPAEPQKALDDMAAIICNRILLLQTKSVSSKCKQLEKVNEYTKKIDPQEHNYIHAISIFNCYYALGKAMDDSPLIREEREKFIERFTRHELTDFTQFYSSILGLVGTIAQGGKPCDISAQTLKRYNLPVIRK